MSDVSISEVIIVILLSELIVFSTNSVVTWGPGPEVKELRLRGWSFLFLFSSLSRSSLEQEHCLAFAWVWRKRHIAGLSFSNIFNHHIKVVFYIFFIL